MSEKQKLNSYHIETLDGTGSFNFFTEARTHKIALRTLITRSNDFILLVKSNSDLTITVKKV